MRAYFFDGQSSHKQTASVQISPDQITLMGNDWSRQFSPSEVYPIEGTGQSAFFINGRDGSCLELQGSAQLSAQLTTAGFLIESESQLVNLAQKSWWNVSLMLIFLSLVLAASYRWILPTAAAEFVGLIPSTVKRQIGTKAYDSIYPQLFAPSKLPPETIARVNKQFTDLDRSQINIGGETSKLYIVSSKIGPNAIAFPGNIFVITDELINLVDRDMDTIAGVLAHELGHARYDHGLRNFVQSTAVLLVTSTIIGDYSSALAGAPAFIANMKFSRGFEREADTYSRHLLCTNKIDPAKTSIFFDKVLAKNDSKALDLIPEYLLSHPKSQERADFFKKPCQR